MSPLTPSQAVLGGEDNSDAPSPTQEHDGLRLADLPAPRLQLRWAPHEGRPRFGDTQSEWDCHYELVLPLGEFDCRRDIYDEDGNEVGQRTELVVPFKGCTIRGSEHEPCWDRHANLWYADAPFRDGAHADWDAAVLGAPPVFVISCGGLAFPLTPKNKEWDGSSPKDPTSRAEGVSK